jgi:hypothetical protein
MVEYAGHVEKSVDRDGDSILCEKHEFDSGHDWPSRMLAHDQRVISEVLAEDHTESEWRMG